MHDIVHKVIDQATADNAFLRRVAEVERLRLERKERAIADAAAKRLRRRQRNLRIAANVR
jgi:hypothetical protein